MRDLRDACRSLKRTPGFTLVVVLTLGLGIGASVTTFSVMQAVWWRGLPYPGAERLVRLTSDTSARKHVGIAGPEQIELGEHSRTLDSIAMFSGVNANLEIDGELERVYAGSATEGALRMFGADPPALGRLLRDREDIGPDGFISAVVISDSLWRRRFGADPAVVGRFIQVNNLRAQIVGVLRPGLKVFLPSEFTPAEDTELWFPRGIGTSMASRNHLLARLAPGVSLAQAQTELDTLSSAFAAARPAHTPPGFRMVVEPLQDLLTARVQPALTALAVAVAFVLLIACVNVTNLMLARAKSREREIAVRAALGARRGRLVSALFTESALLAAAGTVAGLGVAFAGVQLLDWLRPTHLPRQSQIGIDMTVAMFAVAISAAVCVAFGLLPALRITRREDMNPLRSGRSGTSAPGIRRLQRALVIAEVALSIVPLVGGGLMLRSFWNLAHAPIGFDPAGVVSAHAQMSFRAFPDLERRWSFVQGAIDAVKQLPGVEDASAASVMPYVMPNGRQFGRDGDPSSLMIANQQSVAPGYLGVIRARLLEGRDVTADDIRQNRLVAIIDQRLAAKLYPEGAVGQKLATTMGPKPASLEIIGVMAPVRAAKVSDADVPHVFLSYNVMQSDPWLAIRTRASAAALAPDIRRVVEALGSRRPVVDIRPLKDYVDQSYGDTRFTMLLLSAFAAASLLLAGIGMYGTLAYLMSQRTQEFGVRIALGADARAVVGLVAREGVMLTAVGGVLGLALALGLSGGLRGMLYGVAPTDGVTVAGVIALMVSVALAAASVPAWRAARVDPTIALRSE
jgi:putative ABC transport system permease protein